MASIMTFGIKVLGKFIGGPYIASMIDGLLSMNRFVRSMVLSFIGTFFPFSGLWFIHMILGLIFGSIIYAFFKTGGGKQFFYAFLLGVLVTSIVMTIFYYFLNALFEGVLRDLSRDLKGK